MTPELQRLLHRLTLPRARLVWRDYGKDFGIAFWSLEGVEWAETVDDAGLIEQIFNPEAGWLTRVSAEHDRYVYELNDAGRKALKEAEGEPEKPFKS